MFFNFKQRYFPDFAPTTKYYSSAGLIGSC